MLGNLRSVEFLSTQAREQAELVAMEAASRMEVMYEREHLEQKLKTQMKLSSAGHEFPD
jgi:hypothetical protein